MKKQKLIILTILTITAVALAVVSIFAFADAGTSATVTYPSTTASGTNSHYSNGMMSGDRSGMMSGMGGNWAASSTVQTPVTAQNTILPLVGFAALIGAALTGTGGAAYYFAGPKIRIAEPVPKTIVDQAPQDVVTPYASVSKILTTEENKVLGVLVSHNGKYLQKYIRAETGLSRLKTHRIVARLAERGIVALEKSGNTNEVHLSSWLQSKPDVNAIDKREDKLLEIEVRAVQANKSTLERWK